MNRKLLLLLIISLLITGLNLVLGSAGEFSSSTAPSIQWRTVHRENFSSALSGHSPWLQEDYLSESDPYSDNGAYFRETITGFIAPQNAHRSHLEFSEQNWLRIESYSRSTSISPSSFATVVTDPSNAENKVLKITSRTHTDGTILRSTAPLPAEYRICARIGHVKFGSGEVARDRNGYEGHEMAEPWIADAPTINENGFYWLTILDTEPRPRNNIFIHHHRKVVIDSDNNDYAPAPWSKVWNGSSFEANGKHIVMMFALDAENSDFSGAALDRIGQPFISWSRDQWNRQASVNEIRAVNLYLPQNWYRVCITKARGLYGLKMEGDFVFGGHHVYEAWIPQTEVYHSEGTPDYFMLGDPHVNFYRGDMIVDDLSLEIPE